MIKLFLDYFSSKEHTIVPSSSIVPEGDMSVLLTTAGMQQFKSYYLGKPSPYGNRVISIQKCVRVDDIDEVGDETHNTFFEMLGNFSFQYPHGSGSYFKREAIHYGYEFIAEVLNLNIDYVTVFAGDDKTPRDTESYQIWKDLAEEKNIQLEIRECEREDNFWGPTGSEGPCGPTTEIYVGGVEIWNIVFNQYYAQRSGEFEILSSQGIDTGGGFERILTQFEGVQSVYETSLCAPVISYMRELFPDKDEKIYKILFDHVRATLFLISDGVVPSNKEQGYILRRLMRKSFSLIQSPEEGYSLFLDIAQRIRTSYESRYRELTDDSSRYEQLVRDEFHLFSEALKRGMKHAEKILRKKRVAHMSGEEAFLLSSTYGLSPEVMKLNGIHFDQNDYQDEQQKHKSVSRAGVEKKFGGHGLLLDNGEIKAADEKELEQATKLHSATHLLNTALHEMFPRSSIEQRGSDITADRLRFDFTFDRKLTDSEFHKLEALINTYIQKAIPVTSDEMSLSEAKKSGALFLKNRSYPDTVVVYSFGSISKEICGGPHIDNTKSIGRITLKKQEAVSQGVRRIRAMLSS